MASGSFVGSYINGSVSNSYAAKLTQMLATDGWYVVNQSVVGDKTTGAIARFNSDVPAGVDEVWTGYSLFNEGLAGSPNPQAIYNQFFSGITNLIAMARQNGSLPLLGCVYPFDGFSSSEYVFVKNMVLQLSTLDVPYANFLGATDDGHGAGPACVGRIPSSHLIFGGDEWWFYGPRIVAGDLITNEKIPFDYVVKDTKFAGPTCFDTASRATTSPVQ